MPSYSSLSILMAPIRQQPYNEDGQSLFMKDLRRDARPRASIPSPLSTYSMSGEIITNSPPEFAAHIGPRTLPKATVHHGPRRFRQSAQPQGGQLRVVNGKPNARVMASDYGPLYFPFYRHEICVNDAQDVRGPSRRKSDLARNMHREQIYQAYAPKPSSGQSERILDDYRTTACLSDVHHPNHQTLRAHRQCYFDPDLTADREASRGFPILADSYRFDHRPYENLARPKHENSHPHVLRIGKLKHRHASMAVPEAITDPELTASARLQQSFESRRRVRQPRSAMY